MSTARRTTIEILPDDLTVRLDITFASEGEAERFFDWVAAEIEAGSLSFRPSSPAPKEPDQ
ncbi:hypothetical protein [Ancylobacter pratisalsi]|uniref:Uncharacterized protein n=1 Tax=Ancylobacter pratisalsi TaxID=1745854 RepID=A0A6P1YQ01_9HYPH|nr:hypothetical protein [Ancylobacter pratisalsi]QIB34776.1 hypothetical protein G3A50_14455 [Ancylobacter pratisalsi]